MATSSLRPRAEPPFQVAWPNRVKTPQPPWERRKAMVALRTMSLQRRLVEHILAAVLLCAALLAPSLASAHAGHNHHAAAAMAEPVDAPPATNVAGDIKSKKPSMVRREIARASVPANDPDVSNCASHCCGGTANMTCCAAALVPEISVAPSSTTSHALLFARAGALLGLPPEALPKPPKSFA
jgi:hypothetical protein